MKCHAVGEESWSRAFKAHEELALGAMVLVQLQRGPTNGKWKTSGTMVDILEHNYNLVKMVGSGQLSKLRWFS